MSEPPSSLVAPLRALFGQVTRSGWGAMLFWLVLVGVMVVLMVSGYGAFVGANKDNLRFAFVGGLSGFAATAVGAVVAIALRDIAARTQDIMLGFAAGMMHSVQPNFLTPRDSWPWPARAC